MNDKEDYKKTTAVGNVGTRPIKATSVFRLLNFELFVKPNAVIMGIGTTFFLGALGYLGYMRLNDNQPDARLKGDSRNDMPHDKI